MIPIKFLDYSLDWHVESFRENPITRGNGRKY